MDDHERLKEAIGSYVIYGIGSDAEFNDHYQACAQCVDDSKQLSEMVELIRRSAPGLGDLDYHDSRLEAMLRDKPDFAPIRQIASLERSRNRYRFFSFAALAMAILAGASSIALAGADSSKPISMSSKPSHLVGLNIALVSHSANTFGKAIVQYRQWGSQLEITASGLSTTSVYTVIVYSGMKDQYVGSWAGNTLGKVMVNVATSFHPTSISRIQVVDNSGNSVLKSV